MDFSPYGEATEEWTSYVSAHPKILQAETASPAPSLAEMHASTTATRSTQDRENLKESGLEGKVTTRDYQVATRDGSSILLRLYAPNGAPPSEGRPVYVHFHAGGFIHGSLDTEGFVCASIAIGLDVIVLHPCFRHIHEAKHPTQHHDAWDAMVWLLNHAHAFGGDLRNLVVGGISSGAALAASVTQQFCASGRGSEAVRLKGQVLIIPWLVQPDMFPYLLFADVKKTSLVQCADAVSLSTNGVKWISGLLEAEDIRDPLLNPALADDEVLRSLPKTALIVAGGDPLRDDGLIYATRLKQIGFV